MARFHALEVAEIRPETADAVTVRLRVPSDLASTFAWRPGQHLVLRAVAGAEELRRTYSICAAPGERDLTICVKRQPGGRFSRLVHDGLRPGDRLEAMPPAGRFTVALDPDQARLYAAFCAGSGITPVVAMLKAVLAGEPRSRFVLVYGSRTTDDIIFREELGDLKDRYLARLGLYHVLSREPQGLPLLDGRVDAEKVRAFVRSVVPAPAVDTFLLCGPAPMIGSAARVLEEEGAPRNRIHFEYFSADGNPPRPRATAAVVEGSLAGACRVRATLDGRTRELVMAVGTPSLLDAVRAAGLDAPYACKAGVCSTCRARVTEGRAEMTVNYALEEREIEAGYVLTCQARPLTGTLAVDWDAA